MFWTSKKQQLLSQTLMASLAPSKYVSFLKWLNGCFCEHIEVAWRKRKNCFNIFWSSHLLNQLFLSSCSATDLQCPCPCPVLHRLPSSPSGRRRSRTSRTWCTSAERLRSCRPSVIHTSSLSMKVCLLHPFHPYSIYLSRTLFVLFVLLFPPCLYETCTLLKSFSKEDVTVGSHPQPERVMQGCSSI